MCSTSTVPTCMHAHLTNLKILYFNTRSIISKRDELTAICTAEKPHIVCLTETWLDEDIGDHEICFGNYNIVRRNRNRHGGGVAMLIQNSLSFNILVKGTDDLEVIFVSLSCSSGKFCFGIFYRPPSSSVHILDTLENVIFNLDHSFLSNLVLLGDFNVDFHPFSTHPMYSHLCSLIDNLSLMQVVGSNTHVDPNGSESLIDLVFMSSPQALTKCCVTPGLGNLDHYGIYLSLKSSLPAQHARLNKKRTIWRYAHADFDLACTNA